MKTHPILFCLLLITATALQAQQLPLRHPSGALDFVWNPALTAVNAYWEVGVLHQQDWLGFEQAPQTTAIYGYYPFIKEKTGLGMSLVLDEIKPLRNNTLTLNYAYHLPLGATRRRSKQAVRKTPQLSFGLNASLNHLFVDGADIIARDPNDPLEPVGEINVFKPNFGVGVAFASKPAGPQKGSFLFAGLGAQQLIPQQVLFRQSGTSGNLPRALHGNAVIGYRSAGEQLVLEPSLWFNTVGTHIVDAQFNLLAERPNSVWGGMSLGLNQAIGLQVGYALADGFIEGGQLRIGLSGSFSIGGTGQARGSGFGAVLAFRVK